MVNIIYIFKATLDLVLTLTEVKCAKVKLYILNLVLFSYSYLPPCGLGQRGHPTVDTMTKLFSDLVTSFESPEDFVSWPVAESHCRDSEL